MTATLILPEVECSFEVDSSEHKSIWEACSAIISESGIDADLVLSICNQPYRSDRDNHMVGITVLGEATARKLVAYHIGCDVDDEDVDRYIDF